MYLHRTYGLVSAVALLLTVAAQASADKSPQSATTTKENIVICHVASAPTTCSTMGVPGGTCRLTSSPCAAMTRTTSPLASTGYIDGQPRIICRTVPTQGAPAAGTTAQAGCCKTGTCCQTNSADREINCAITPVASGSTTPALADLTGGFLGTVTGVDKPLVVTAIAPAAGGPVLGVQLGEVSDILSAHFDLKPGQAVTILNIVKDSPADRAGLQRYDIITAINGKKIEGGVGKVAESIGAMKVGESVSLDVIRQGRQMRVDAVLAERQASPEWKFEFTPEVTSEDAMNIRGRLIRPDESGAWIIEDLDDLDEDVFKNLPETLRRLLPQGQNLVQQFFVDGSRQSIRIERTIDGNTIVIEQDSNGSIDVIRKSPGAPDQSAHYENREALRKADPEAADLLEGSSVHVFRGYNGLVPPPGPGGFSIPPESRVPPPRPMDDLRQRLREAEEQLRNALKDMERDWSGWPPGQDGAWRDRLRSHLDALNDMLRNRGSFGGMGMGPNRARQTFHVNPDGSIEVHMRKDDSEMVRTFRNAEELKNSDPRLYEKYQSMINDQ